MKKMELSLGVASEPKVLLAQAEAPSWLAYVLGLLAVLLYLNTLGHQYAFDDAIVITGNRFTQQGLAGCWDLLTRDFFEGIYGDQGMELTGGRYRPLSLLMFALEYELFGLNPMVGHVVNVLLYGFTAWLMHGFLRHYLGSASVLPFLVTLLFVVHPVHTEIVANIKSRDEILALLFGLLALRSRSLFLGLFLMFLALLAKETAIVLVVLYPLFLYVFEPKLNFWPRVGAWYGLALAYVVLRTILVGGVGSETNPDIMENPFVGASFVERYGTIGVILWKYAALLFWPWPLSSDYSYNQIPWTSFANPWSLAGWFLHGGIFFGAWYAWRRAKGGLAWALGVYLLPFGLVSNALFNIGAPMGERFLYMGSFGALLGLGLVLPSAWQTWAKWSGSWVYRGLSLGLALVFAVLTWKRNPDWYNNRRLFGADVKAVPNSAKIHYYYGNALLNDYLAASPAQRDAGLLLQAAAALENSVRINPKFHTAWYNLGLVAFEGGRGPEAKAYLLQTLALQPNHLLSTELIAKTYGRFFNNADSALYYQERYVLNWGQKTPESWKNLGIFYAMKGQVAKAREAFQASLALDPNNASTLYNYGVGLQANGLVEEGMDWIRKAQALDPSLVK